MIVIGAQSDNCDGGVVVRLTQTPSQATIRNPSQRHSSWCSDTQLMYGSTYSCSRHKPLRRKDCWEKRRLAERRHEITEGSFVRKDPESFESREDIDNQPRERMPLSTRCGLRTGFVLSWRRVPGRGSTFTVLNELNSAAA
eukprot:COSAG04_NODE_7165_length_1176_cov_1.065924_1_plen_140_part_10